MFCHHNEFQIFRSKVSEKSSCDSGTETLVFYKGAFTMDRSKTISLQDIFLNFFKWLLFMGSYDKGLDL